jgi:hypothetical protein
MPENWKEKALPVLILLAAFAIYLLWLWQPERQVMKHQENILKSIEKRNWSSFAKFIAADYSDRWKHDRTFVLRESREIFRHFFAVEIESGNTQQMISGGKGLVTAQIRLAGNGTPIAELVKQEVNSLREPFSFEWKRKSWKPWDWQLVRLDHPRLNVNRRSEF